MPKSVPTPDDLTDVIFVEWVDPCTWNQGIFDLADAKDLRPHTLRSAGILVGETEEVITFAADVDLENETARFVSSILKKNIVSMRRWKWKE